MVAINLLILKSEMEMKDKISKLGIFSITQTFYQIGTVMLMAVSVLAGQTISPTSGTAAIPLSFSVLGTFAGLFPASLCMKKLGRKNGLLLGTIIGISGAVIASYGLYSNNFSLFTLGHLFYGFHQSFLQYLRFAAMESVPNKDRSTALSWILLAGIPAAFLGPLAGFFGRNLFAHTVFLGCFLILTAVLFFQFLLISRLQKITNLTEELTIDLEKLKPSRPISFHLKNPGLWASVISSSFGFGLMVMLMSAVPIAMKAHGHEMHSSTIVLQWHVLGMYIPSFFSGYLVNKFGSPKLIIAGIFILALEVFAALQGTGFLPFAVALVLLGIGWNFMYVGGTNLLVDQYRNSEKNSIQALNDSFVYLLATISTYSSAYLETNIGWFNLNLVALPFLFLALLTVILFIRSKPKSVKNIALKLKKDHWEKIYATKQPEEVSWTQEIPQTSLNFINDANLPKSAKIIDIGGGDSKFVDYLIEEGFENITVLDISEHALDRAKNRLGEKSKQVKWIVSDVTDFQVNETYDFWHDRAAFHFLTTEPQIVKYISLARHAVKENGIVTIGTFSENGPIKCSGLEIKQYSEESLTSELKKGFQKIKCITEDHITPFMTKQNFLFCSFKKSTTVIES